jgi:mannose-6-phosphate isomerase-like protein (cupin superfamily)
MVVVVPDAVTVPAVADALRHIAITGVFYCPSYLREPWGGSIPPMPGCVWFHAVTSGHGELVVDGDRLELRPGDLALVPHGSGHVIEAGGPSEYPLIPDLPHEEQSDNYAVLRYGKDGPLTELICGGLRFEHPSARRLLDSLPPVVHIRTVRRTAVGATLHLLADEVQRREVGSEAVVSRLCDILVIQAIRHWMTSDEATSSP